MIIMNITLPLPDNQKLTVTYRIEPGCLGPEGVNHVDDFCIFVQERVIDLYPDFIKWLIVPRNDKSLPEMEYAISNKQLDHDKVNQYLQLFDQGIDEFEDYIQGECVGLINQYFDR